MKGAVLHPTARAMLRATEQGETMRHFIECDVRGPSRFDVELVDGRVFMGCGVYGAGGPIRGERALERARGHVNGAVLVAWPVQLLTICNEERSAVQRIAASDVVSIENARGLVTVTVGVPAC